MEKRRLLTVATGPAFGALTLVEGLEASVRYYEEAQRQYEAQGLVFTKPTVTDEQLSAAHVRIGQICTRALRRMK